MALDAPSRDVRDALQAAAARVEADADRIAGEMAAAMHRDVPELPDDPRTHADTRRTALEIVRSFVRVVRRGEPPAAAEPVRATRTTARALARMGTGIGPLLRLIHVGQEHLLLAWDEQLAALDLPADVLLDSTRASRRLTLQLIDAATQRLSAEYERERERTQAGATAQRAETIQALLAGQTYDPDAVSRTLGYELGRHHTALVLWTPEEETDARESLAAAARDVAAALGAGRPLLLPVARTLTWAWIGTAGPPGADALRAAAGGRRADGVSVAVGEPAIGAAGFRASHRDAEDAFRVALLGRRRPGTVTTYGAVELAALHVSDLDRTRRFVRRALGALAADDDEHGRLRATLRVFLDEHRSRQAAAARLGIHPNTVGNRVHACETLLGDRLDGSPVELHVALALAQQLGPAVLAPR